MIEELKDRLVVGGLELVVPPVRGGGQAEGYLAVVQVPQQLLGTCHERRGRVRHVLDRAQAEDYCRCWSASNGLGI